MSANDIQIGGGHYKTGYEHWDLVIDLNLGYLEAQATRYLSRWRKKNGMEDLQKSLHYLDKMIEAQATGRYAPTGPGKAPSAQLTDVYARLLTRFYEANGINNTTERLLISMFCFWHSAGSLKVLRERLVVFISAVEQSDQQR